MSRPRPALRPDLRPDLRRLRLPLALAAALLGACGDKDAPEDGLDTADTGSADDTGISPNTVSPPAQSFKRRAQAVFHPSGR